MHYMLLFNETSAERAKRQRPGSSGRYWGWQAYIGAIAQSGAMGEWKRLQPPEVARPSGGERQAPRRRRPVRRYQGDAGGYVIVDVADLDGALEWASRAPCVTGGSVEIRPVLPPPSA
jgi:hypothetical protein